MSMNILMLHAMEPGGTCRRKTRTDHLYSFERYASDNRYYYHNILEPVTAPLKDSRFHAVVLDTTAVSMRVRRPRHKFIADMERYAFLADWDAVKIAVPQDEYDHSELLDRWLSDCRFDVVYSVLPEHGGILYPKMSKQAAIYPALTGYVNDMDVDPAGPGSRFPPLSERNIDIGYRASFLPAWYGSYGQTKGLMAERLRGAIDGYGLVADISTDPDDVILGDDWLAFLADCRFCLGSKGGSSLLDRRGQFRDRVVKYTKGNPTAGYSQIEAACFPGEDRRWVFSAISPRLFEAAVAGCGQILIEDSYLDVLEPWTHYLPIDAACENAPEVIECMRDRDAMQRMVHECYDALIATPRFRYSTFVTEVVNKIANLVVEKHVQGASAGELEAMIARHQQMLPDERRRDGSRSARLKRSIAKWRWRVNTGLFAK